MARCGKAVQKGEKKGKLLRGRVDMESERGQLIFPCMGLSLGWWLGDTAESVRQG